MLLIAVVEMQYLFRVVSICPSHALMLIELTRRSSTLLLLLLFLTLSRATPIRLLHGLRHLSK